jgi:hypothetical protein
MARNAVVGNAMVAMRWSDRGMALLTGDLRGLAALFATSGTLHLIRPQLFGFRCRFR